MAANMISVDQDNHTISAWFPSCFSNKQVCRAVKDCLEEYASKNYLQSTHVSFSPEMDRTWNPEKSKYCYLHVRDVVAFNLLTGKNREGEDLVDYTEKELSVADYSSVMEKGEEITEEDLQMSCQKTDVVYKQPILLAYLFSDGISSKISCIPAKCKCTHKADTLYAVCLPEKIPDPVEFKAALDHYITSTFFFVLLLKQGRNHVVTIKFRECVHASMALLFVKLFTHDGITYKFNYYKNSHRRRN